MKIIQIGCNDGSDHVLEFCKQNLKNIKYLNLIDADKDSLLKCSQIYKELFQDDFDKIVKIENLAISPVDCKELQLFAPEDEKLSGFISFNYNHVKAHLHSEKIRSFYVPARSLNNILLFSGNNIDWLFIDTEGLDALNLFSIDFSLFRIQNIVFEHIHTDGIVRTGPRFNALCYYLQQFGYKFRQDEKQIGSYNTLAYL